VIQLGWELWAALYKRVRGALLLGVLQWPRAGGDALLGGAPWRSDPAVPRRSTRLAQRMAGVQRRPFETNDRFVGVKAL